MISEKFRRQLRQESEQWWAEGLIDAALYDKLAARYQFARLEGEASNRFIAILLGLGAVLLGLGAITFVAANWQEWSRSLKLVLLVSVFVAVNATGFYLWRKPSGQGSWHRLGHGLLLLGALLLGANLGLMSQMFHQSGDLYELLLVWGLGVAAMAYSLRLTSLGVLSILLIAIAYCFSWFSSIVWNELSSTALVIQHLPLVVSAVFVPLAYWCRSRVIFGLSAIAIAISFTFNFKPYSSWSVGWLLAIAFVLPPALLWSYSDRLWQRRPPAHTSSSGTPSRSDSFQAISSNVAIGLLGILLYTFAFHYWWEMDPNQAKSWIIYFNWFLLIDAGVLGLVTLLGWWRLRHQFRRSWQHQAINHGSVALVLLSTAALFIAHTTVGHIATLAFNLMLFLLALGLIRDGLALTQRGTFWGGMVLLVLGIMSRTLEYNTGLLLKSIVLVLCGAIVIAAGLWFERRIQPRRTVSLPHSSQE